MSEHRNDTTVTLAIGLVMLVLLLARCPKESRDGGGIHKSLSMTQKVLCKNHLDVISSSLNLYRISNRGHLPPLEGSGGMLHGLWKSEIPERRIEAKKWFECPGLKRSSTSEEFRTDYRCWTGGELTSERVVPFKGKVAIVWEPIENHGDVLHVLFYNGQVQSMGPESLESHLVEMETKLGLKR